MKSETKQRATPTGMASNKNSTNHDKKVQAWTRIGEPYHERPEFIKYYLRGWVDEFKRADSWIKEVENIIANPSPYLTEFAIELYKRMLSSEKQNRTKAKQRIRWLGRCYDKVTSGNKFYRLPTKGHVDTKSLKENIDCRDLAESYLSARRNGKTARALCPFHTERTASFYAYQDGFKCFGCQWSGDAFKFVMEMENINFPTALEKVKHL